MQSEGSGEVRVSLHCELAMCSDPATEFSLSRETNKAWDGVTLTHRLISSPCPRLLARYQVWNMNIAEASA